MERDVGVGVGGTIVAVSVIPMGGQTSGEYISKFSIDQTLLV